MKFNTESTKFDRFRMAIGTVFAVFGALILTLAATIFGLSNLTLLMAGFLLVLSGVLIAGSAKLSELISGLLHFH